MNSQAGAMAANGSCTQSQGKTPDASATLIAGTFFFFFPPFLLLVVRWEDGCEGTCGVIFHDVWISGLHAVCLKCIL